ncbi:MAG: hypothetical protein DRP59_10710 [Spirochaetes bacterium]|nr:MAG: hypothetical protein DRP59_10710 [Spirochaetota bacterium]
MSIMKYLSAQPLYDIVKYDGTENFIEKAVSFKGSPRKHPYDTEKIILIVNPFSSDTFFYEFLIKDIIHYDELPKMVTESGETLSIVRLWVLKGTIGMKYTPFEVDDPIRFLNDSEILHQVLKKSPVNG